ncbi:ComEC/Rec2 family competence protein [Poseidonibacter lekithochrous]|uniref:ComEC/Rec2 family competence protein n=1 Tax=Poseidonibacter lekithochrous TaxID=1904463 RepID=UPI0008FC2A99|nr:MBL fold metallo-hydrolase [Poseidonibacter lekithochrous]QKJ23821.1 MBL fold metallohydrolase [Poseidonibacter lekithochrous]
MGYEIDFIAVGEESKSGDAIAIRFGDLEGDRSNQTVVVIDGGYKKSGEDLVSHIKEHYCTDVVDLVILTHPDSDHASGLHVVLEELTVKKLWMHKPWEHNDGKAVKFVDGRITDNSISERLKSALETAYQLHNLAVRKSIPIEEPFTGTIDTTGLIEVVGPTIKYYNELLLGFSGMPELKLESSNESLFTKAKDVIMEWISDGWDIDLITDNGETTSPQNHSSAVVQITIENRRLLFTGDAGKESLQNVADYIGHIDNMCDLQFIQIPHHGSFRNIGPTVLNKLVGEKKSKEHVSHFTAFCSSAKNGAPKHPSKKVLNAFTRRGARVIITAGGNKCLPYNAPEREGWTSIDPEPFHEKVEA